jgi:hypothetical protein
MVLKPIYTLSAVLLFCALALGFQHAQRVHFVLNYTADGAAPIEGRGPSAIRADLDFSKLKDRDLAAASQTRILSAAKVINTGDGRLGLTLGHFATRDHLGRKALACDVFASVELVFEGEGVAEAGEKPTFTVRAPCETEADFLQLRPIWIPIADIINQAPNSGTIVVAKNQTIEFQNIPSSWPERWLLTSIKFGSLASAVQSAAIKNSEGTSSTSQLLNADIRREPTLANEFASQPQNISINYTTLKKWRQKIGIIDFVIQRPKTN